MSSFKPAGYLLRRPGGEGFAVDASLIQADANKQRSIAGQDWRMDRDPKRSSRAVREYMATLDDTAWGTASDVVPKYVSPSDPAAQWTGAHKGPASGDQRCETSQVLGDGGNQRQTSHFRFLIP